MRPRVFRVYSESTERLRKPKLSSKPGGCSLEGYGVVLPALVPAKPSEEWLERIAMPFRAVPPTISPQPWERLPGLGAGVCLWPSPQSPDPLPKNTRRTGNPRVTSPTGHPRPATSDHQVWLP